MKKFKKPAMKALAFLTASILIMSTFSTAASAAEMPGESAGYEEENSEIQAVEYQTSIETEIVVCVTEEPQEQETPAPEVPAQEEIEGIITGETQHMPDTPEEEASYLAEDENRADAGRLEGITGKDEVTEYFSKFTQAELDSWMESMTDGEWIHLLNLFGYDIESDGDIPEDIYTEILELFTEKKVITASVQEILDILGGLPESWEDRSGLSSFDEYVEFLKNIRSIMDDADPCIESLSQEELEDKDLSEALDHYYAIRDAFLSWLNPAGMQCFGTAVMTADAGSSVSVSSVSTTYMDNYPVYDFNFVLSNGAVAKCGEIMNIHPGVGSTLTAREYTGADAETIKKILYYGADGPGQVSISVFQNAFINGALYISSLDSMRAVTSFALSYAVSGVDERGQWPSAYASFGETMYYVFRGMGAVPSTVTLYECVPSNSVYQRLFYIGIPAEGSISLKKVTSPASAINKYSVEGAVYLICTSATAGYKSGGYWYGFVTDAKGTGYAARCSTSDNWRKRDSWQKYGGTAVEVPEGTYYVKEIITPSCGSYELDTNLYPASVNSGVTTPVNSTEKLSTAPLYLKKSSQASEWCTGNSLYSLEGAVYKIYNRMVADDRYLVATLTTKADGTTNTVELTRGTYYYIETKPSSGHTLDSQSKQGRLTAFEISEENDKDNPKVLNVTDPVLNDPLKITIDKRSSVDYKYALPLAGVQFEICYYDNLNGKTTGTPLRTWIIQTKFNALNSRFQAQLDDEWLVSGSPLYKINGTAVLPVGTYTIRESVTAGGYTIKGGTMYPSSDPSAAVDTETGMLTFIVQSINDDVIISTGNVYTGNNVPVIMNTTALSDGLHYIDAGSNDTATIVDTVLLENLDTGMPYRLTGKLYDTATGTAVGSPQVLEFTVDTGTTSKELTYNLTDVKTLKGRAYTACATLEAYVNDGWIVMAEEKDMSNTQQTIS
ncbi:MAG: VaFE repeat-containing surface-anchored protein, partial [Parasporobacterium sp.]|nr:VaFE repeat-containing surface-anchored protein [Parasporobacterium sp.]